MVCTGDPGRSGDIQQGSRRLLIRDGYDRGQLQMNCWWQTIIYLIKTKAFSGAVPFSDRVPRVAMLAIAEGERPSRPTHPGLTDGLWALTQRWWDQEAHRRPHVLKIPSGSYVSGLKPPV